MNAAWTAAVALLLLCPAAAQADEALQLAKAKALFDQYVRYEETYDAAIVNLYADTALIRGTHRKADGSAQTMVIPPQEYQELLRKTLPEAEANKVLIGYSDVAYAVEGERVRITCTALSTFDGATGPLQLLVGPGPGGDWLIFEELSEFRLN